MNHVLYDKVFTGEKEKEISLSLTCIETPLPEKEGMTNATLIKILHCIAGVQDFYWDV